VLVAISRILRSDFAGCRVVCGAQVVPSRPIAPLRVFPRVRCSAASRTLVRSARSSGPASPARRCNLILDLFSGGGRWGALVAVVVRTQKAHISCSPPTARETVPTYFVGSTANAILQRRYPLYW
jgi:hypothetical protein